MQKTWEVRDDLYERDKEGAKVLRDEKGDIAPNGKPTHSFSDAYEVAMSRSDRTIFRAATAAAVLSGIGIAIGAIVSIIV